MSLSCFRFTPSVQCRSGAVGGTNGYCTKSLVDCKVSCEQTATCTGINYNAPRALATCRVAARRRCRAQVTTITPICVCPTLLPSATPSLGPTVQPSSPGNHPTGRHSSPSSRSSSSPSSPSTSSTSWPSISPQDAVMCDLANSTNVNYKCVFSGWTCDGHCPKYPFAPGRLRDGTR